MAMIKSVTRAGADSRVRGSANKAGGFGFLNNFKN